MTVATVRVRLGAQALKKLAGATAQVKVRVVVRAGGTKKVSVAQAKISRPASSESGSGGSTPTTPTTPTSTPIEGEPPLLTRPATAVTVSSVTLSWMPRDSWVRYVSSGTAANDGVVAGAGGDRGRLDLPRPAPTGPSESSASLNYTINFAAKESWYDPFKRRGRDLRQRQRRLPLHLPHDQPDRGRTGDRDRRLASRAIFRFNGSGGTPYPNQRVALETLETAGRPIVSNER